MTALYLIVPTAIVLFLLLRAVALGYPPAPLARPRIFSRKEQAIVAACADALFPPGGPIPISGTEAGLVEYLDGYVGGLPPVPRLLGRLLFHSVEHGPWAFGPRRVRFTSLRPEERIVALRELYESRHYFRRVSALSMRAMMTMGYLANPRVAELMRMRADLAPFERRGKEPPPETTADSVPSSREVPA